MKKILLSVLCTALVACETPPTPATIHRLTHAAITSSAQEYRLPKNDPRIIQTAQDSLVACGVILWMGLPVTDGPQRILVATAIRNALPATTRKEQIRALFGAADSLKNETIKHRH